MYEISVSFWARACPVCEMLCWAFVISTSFIGRAMSYAKSFAVGCICVIVFSLC